MNIENMDVPIIGQANQWKCDFCGAGLIVVDHPEKGKGYMPECNCMRPILLGDFVHWLASTTVLEDHETMIQSFVDWVDKTAMKERGK